MIKVIGVTHRWFIDQWYAQSACQAGWHVGVKGLDKDTPADIELVDIAHVTRLKAEVELWKDTCSDIAARRDELKAELDHLRGAQDAVLYVRQQDIDWSHESKSEVSIGARFEPLNEYQTPLYSSVKADALQSERDTLKSENESFRKNYVTRLAYGAVQSDLAKARELLRDAWPTQDWYTKRDAFLAYQSTAILSAAFQSQSLIVTVK